MEYSLIFLEVLTPSLNNPQTLVFFFPVWLQKSNHEFWPPMLNCAGILVPLDVCNSFFLFSVAVIRLASTPYCAIKSECRAVLWYNSGHLNTRFFHIPGSTLLCWLPVTAASLMAWRACREPAVSKNVHNSGELFSFVLLKWDTFTNLTARLTNYIHAT